MSEIITTSEWPRAAQTAGAVVNTWMRGADMAQPTLAELPARLRSKIRVDDASGCWVWIGCTTRTGYGRAWDATLKRTDWAHRVVYRALVGPIPDGLTLDHVRARGCVHLACVWPGHLEPVTTQINTTRSSNPAVTRARHQSKTVCVNGHPLTAANVTVRGGSRHCKTCAKAYAMAYRERNAEAIRKHDRERWRARRDADVLLELANG
jgi:hypothetical protein